MTASDFEPDFEQNEQVKDVPLCLRCAKPVDPLSHYCPHCGEATGQLTPYIPFVNLRLQIGFYGQLWRQLWFGDISFLGRVFRLIMIVVLIPILLLAMPLVLWDLFKNKTRK